MVLINIGICGLVIGYEIYQISKGIKEAREELKDILKDYYEHEYGRPVDKSVFHDLRDRMKR